MVVYLLKSNACLLVFLLFYKLFLEKENMHVFKRFYLLGTIIVSFCIPFITFTSYISVSPMQEFATIDAHLIPFSEEDVRLPVNYLPIILWTIYGFGVSLFAFKFIFNLWRIITKIRKNPHFKKKSFINVLLEDLVAPHTFFNYIFLDRYKFETKQIPKEVILHEETHAKQKHTVDILFVELLQILFWFNPFIYVAKHAIKLNHEFLADRAVLNQGISTSIYQNILLNFSSTNEHPQLTNAINYSFIKKRFTIMKTQTSKRAGLVRVLILLPLLALLVYGFSERIMVEQYDPQIEEKVLENQDKMTRNDVIEYNKKWNDGSPDFYYTKQTFWIKDKFGEKQPKKFHELSELHKKKWLIFPPDIHTKEQISNLEFDKLKDASRYVVRINGVLIDNTKLKRYKSTDFVTFSKNDISSLAYLPQKYHYNLMTSKGLEMSRLLKESIEKRQKQDKATPAQLAEYNRLANYYNSMSKESMTVKLKDVKRLEYLYSIMSASQKKSAQKFPNFPPPPPPPPIVDTGNIKKGSKELQAVSKQFYEITENYIDAIRKYYKTKTNYSDLKPLFKRVMDVHKVYAALAKKENVAVPPPPPPAPDPKIIEEEEIEKKREILEIIGEEKEIQEEQETIEEREIEEKVAQSANGLNPVFKNFVANMKKKGAEFYFDNRKVSPQVALNFLEANMVNVRVENKNSEKPIVKLSQKKGVPEIIEVVPPVPPTPPNPLDHIIDLAKKGATFYYKDNKISSDKAIELVKQRTNMHIQVRKGNSNSAIVYLSNKPSSNKKN